MTCCDGNGEEVIENASFNCNLLQCSHTLKIRYDSIDIQGKKRESVDLSLSCTDFSFVWKEAHEPTR